MKIYSKFQDYYDSALGSFIESEVVYNRSQETDIISLMDIPDLGEEFFPKYTDHDDANIKNKPQENALEAFHGAEDEIRTRDVHLGKVTLYH